MDIQTVIVIAIVAFAVLYLVKKYSRAAKGRDGCGCGCGAGECPAEKRNRCGEDK